MDKFKKAVEGGETLVQSSNQSIGNLNNINKEIESISREIKNLTIETQNVKDVDV